MTKNEISSDEVLRAGSRKNKSPPIYADPFDESRTWNGKGHVPSWFRDELARGNTREHMLINKPVAASHDSPEHMLIEPTMT